jgi:hypothetical protein
MTVNGTYTPDGIRIDDARGTIEFLQHLTNLRKPLRLEGLTYAQVTALIVHLDDLRRDMRYTAGQAKRNP